MVKQYLTYNRYHFIVFSNYLNFQITVGINVAIKNERNNNDCDIKVGNKSNENIIPQYDYNKRPRRQDIKEKDISYKENGSLYIFSYEHFKKCNNRLGGKIGYIIFPEEYSLEIDTQIDFEIMEKLFNKINEGKINAK